MTDPNHPLKVFLCHASADKPAVRELYQRLENDGVDAWLDSEDLIPGQNWRAEIPNAVRDSDVVLICLSDNSVNKEGYVQKEITFALDKALEMPEGRIFLIPARLENCDVPQRLSSYQWVDLFSENGYERLMMALNVRAEEIGAEPPGRKGWLPKIGSKPVVSKQDIPSVPKDQKSSGNINTVPMKEPGENKRSKLKTEYVVLIIGAVVTLVAAIIGPPLSRRWFSPAPESTAAVSTQVPSSPSVALATVPTTEIFTHTPTAFPSETTDAKGVIMVLVPEGEFTMGSDKGETHEQPVHKIFLDAYYIDKYEVTNSFYRVCVEVGLCKPPASTKNYSDPKYVQHPVVYVDWNMAQTYCEWRGARLPTEAEWEKAARGTDERTYPWGELIDDTFANYNGKIGGTTPVGSYEKGKSTSGAYDMAGNVWEWVADWYDENYYSDSPPVNPLGPESGQFHVLRSGAYFNPNITVRSASREKNGPDPFSNAVGFRCARGLSLPSAITDVRGVQMVLVPAGEFTMGSDSGDYDEKPPHDVFLDAYYIDKYEVTNALYKVCVEAGVCDLPTTTNDYNDSQYTQHPVVYVIWNMAKEYCEWRGARLPTEAEWEKAARGTDGRTYPWGEGIYETFANYNLSRTTPVGKYPKGISPYGAYDMAGNVWEWVADWYSENYYASSPNSNPLGPENGGDRVLRGGSWSDPRGNLRSANRYGYNPTNAYRNTGFRCSRSP